MRTTITLNDQLYHALRVRAAERDETLSGLVEEAIKNQLLEDLEDIEDAKARMDEPSESFNGLVKKFEAEGLL